ncbi:hypothetical protein V6N12_050535 [Hibiscus sabdariffa]|uniref:Uncharacterized protein n=1 Tax=Hibiscus sabdariffa TaxID=183260 RepID=A0ABR2GCP0_9ROSI
MFTIEFAAASLPEMKKIAAKIASRNSDVIFLIDGGKNNFFDPSGGEKKMSYMRGETVHQCPKDDLLGFFDFEAFETIWYCTVRSFLPRTGPVQQETGIPFSMDVTFTQTIKEEVKQHDWEAVAEEVDLQRSITRAEALEREMVVLRRNVLEE